MFEITRYESERKLLGTLVIIVGLSLFTAMFLAIAPDMMNSIDIDAMLEAYPEAFRTAFGIQTMSTLAGFLATELYQFGWVLLLGLYFAYSAGGTIAGDVERDRMDMLLATPISRRKVVVEKYVAFLAPILAINVVVGAVVLTGSVVIDDALPIADLVAVHALSIPYLLACAGIGLLLSTIFDRADIAQRGAIGVVFGLFMVESLVTGTDYEWLGVLSPTRYYDPTTVLVNSTYDLAGTAILLGASVALVVASVLWFRHRDI